MSSRQKVSPIAKARASKQAEPSKRPSPIAREREDVEKGKRRASPAGAASSSKVSPIARARDSKKETEKKKSPQLIHNNLEVAGEDDDYEFPPLSVPFGLECYLTKSEIEAATAFIKSHKELKFQLYTVDYDEDSKDKKKEYESVLVFCWFRPAVGVDIHDIWKAWEEKVKCSTEEKERGKWWHELLWEAKLMPKGTVNEDIRYPEMLDPVEEEPEDQEDS